jgi:ADP-heptose:LPS heptosyltransferase
LKILILRFSSIGDIVLTTPVIRCLKVQLDNAEIHFATKPQFKSILEENPYLSRIHLLEGSNRELAASLKKEAFDVVIDLHHNWRTWQIKRWLGVPAHSFRKLNVEKWLLVNLKINRLPNLHIVDRYLETVAHLGIKNDDLGLDYFIPDRDNVETEWLPETHRAGYVAYAIGAQHATKRLPVSRMIELCDKINRPIVLLGGKEDFERGEEVARFFEPKQTSAGYEAGLEALGKRALVYNACGKYNLNQSASLVKKARYVFTHDTGLMHVAAAFRKEVFSVWGNTVPAFGMYPYHTRFTVLENNRLSCRPCSKLGHTKCPKGHFKCMNDIVFDFYLPWS